MTYKSEDKKIKKDVLVDQIKYTINYRSTKAKRLLKSESFIQQINILYSCFGAFLSVWSLLAEHIFISFIATIVSIILVVSITYLNSQRYAARAKDLDANILDLRNLQAEVLTELSEEKLTEKEKTYNSYLAASEVEEDYDKLYFDIFENMSNKSRKQKIHKLRIIQFYIMMIFRVLLKCIIIILPFIMTAFLIYSVLTGSISYMDSLCQMNYIKKTVIYKFFYLYFFDMG